MTKTIATPGFEWCAVVLCVTMCVNGYIGLWLPIIIREDIIALDGHIWKFSENMTHQNDPGFTDISKYQIYQMLNNNDIRIDFCLLVFAIQFLISLFIISKQLQSNILRMRVSRINERLYWPLGVVCIDFPLTQCEVKWNWKCVNKGANWTFWEFDFYTFPLEWPMLWCFH